MLDRRFFVWLFFRGLGFQGLGFCGGGFAQRVKKKKRGFSVEQLECALIYRQLHS